MNTIEQLVDALNNSRPHKENFSGFDEFYAACDKHDEAIAAGEAELRREPVAEVCDCEGTTDDDGRPLHYALLYLLHPLPPETKLYLREATK